MQKKSVFALLLVLMLVMSGCALVTKDTEKDYARTIIDVNGETVSKRTILAAVDNQIAQNQYYNQLFANSGYSASFATDEATVTSQIVEAYTENLVTKQKALAEGFDKLTEEEQTEVETNAKNYYDSFIKSVVDSYFANTTLEGDELTAAAEKYVKDNAITTGDGRSTLEDFVRYATENKAIEKLEADIVKDVTVSEEEITADFDSKVEAAKTQMESNPDQYGYSLMNGSPVYYAPAGYRMIKHILVGISEEDNKVIEEKQTALTDAQTALNEAAEDADKTALQAAVDAAQAELDAAKAQGMANAKVKADEVYAKATAESADFDALIAEYSTDNMPAEGYAVREGYAYFVESFVKGAMALQNVGDVSEPVESTYGYHVIKYVSDVQEGPVDLATVHDSISASLLSTKQDTLQHETIEKWVSEANVKTYLDRMN